jgi:hypothetical protein
LHDARAQQTAGNSTDHPKESRRDTFDNDAKGCYDRIISGIALDCLKHIGYLKNSVRMLALLHNWKIM